MSVLSTAGSSPANAQYQIEWTLGQVASGTYENEEFRISEGIHQGSQLLTTGFENLPGPFIWVYPNPTQGMLFIDLSTISGNSFQIKLITTEGRILRDKLLVGPKGSFDIGELPAGAYRLLLYDEQRVIKSFTIIKQ